MAQTTQPPDPQFIETLKGSIKGRFFAGAKKYDVDKIRNEFPNCVADRALVADEQFMDNLMFLVRKREVWSLRADVERVFRDGGLKPEAEVSALKTWYACGDQAERDKIDDLLVRRLTRQKHRFDALETLPALEWADRIGGTKTRDLLKEWHEQAVQEQIEAEKQTPVNHVRIGRLDQRRSSLDTQVFKMSKRIDITGKGEGERAAAMTELYLRQAGQLAYWSYKELVAHPTPAAVQGVRDFLGKKLMTLVPAEGISERERAEMMTDNRLRGLCLLEAMGATLNERERTFFDEHAEEVAKREDYFRPGYDWEDVLDRQ